MRNDDHTTPFEQELGALLRQTGGGFEPDPARLTEAGLRRGRARVFRRRAGVMGGAAAVALLSVGAVQLTGGGSGTPVADGVPQSREDMVETLSGMLPGGIEILAGEATSPLGAEEPGIYLQLGDSTPGNATLGVMIHRWAMEGSEDSLGCMVPDSDGYHCAEEELPDGAVLTRTQEDLLGEDEELESRHWMAMLEVPDGNADASWSRTVTVGFEKEMTDLDDPDGYQPLIDQDQLAEIATAPVWQEVFDLLDETYGTPDIDTGPELIDVAPDVLRDLFRSLAPGRLDITEDVQQSSGPGEIYLVVDDGQGPGYVSVMLWEPYDIYGPYEPGWEDPVEEWEEDEYCGSEPLADGVRLDYCDLGPSADDPVGVWTVSLYLPDGSSMDITMSNTAGIDDPDAPTRSDSPLTMEELRELASAPEWRDLFR
ncbi:hypothetical protein [Streptomyces ginkgonis]|uniref:hypothetical protein n=1 Tax=Streptomyces ginkgonis TaxID=1812259 RepID=UPI002176D8D4|nr:hypothetical protein [Streptomyces ginkgonis]